MALRFKPGQLVICVKSNDPKWSMLVGAVGEIKQVIAGDPFMALLGCSNDYVVDFPAHRDTLCPNCAVAHGEHFGMDDDELKPLEDPDADEVTEDRKLNIGFDA